MQTEKVGRNEACPCGSGKKYKRCCLGKEERTTPRLVPMEVMEAFAALFDVIHDAGYQVHQHIEEEGGDVEGAVLARLEVEKEQLSEEALFEVVAPFVFYGDSQEQIAGKAELQERVAAALESEEARQVHRQLVSQPFEALHIHFQGSTFGGYAHRLVGPNRGERIIFDGQADLGQSRQGEQVVGMTIMFRGYRVLLAFCDVRPPVLVALTEEAAEMGGLSPAAFAAAFEVPLFARVAAEAARA